MTAGPIFHAYFGFEPQKQTNLCLLISGWQRVKWTNFYSFVMLQFFPHFWWKIKVPIFLECYPLWTTCEETAQRCKWAHPIHKVELIKFVAKNPPCSSKGTEINVRGGWIGSGCIFHVSMMRSQTRTIWIDWSSQREFYDQIFRAKRIYRICNSYWIRRNMAAHDLISKSVKDHKLYLGETENCA